MRTFLQVIVSLALALPALRGLLADDASAETARKTSLDPARLARIRERMQEHVERKEVAGAVTLVGRRGSIAHLEAVGFQDTERKIPMKTDSIFRIASMTKPITAIGVLMLEEDGKLSLDDSVERRLPEFRGQMMVRERSAEAVTLVKPPRPITLRDLLTHTSGLPGGPPPGLAELYSQRDRSLAEGVLVFSQRPLEFEPGSRWSYSNAGIDTLGRVIEVASGKPYEGFLEERLFRPLGMKDTFCFVPDEKRERVAGLYRREKDALAPAESFLGGSGGKYPLPAGGLYSTAEDLARLYAMMLHRGVHEGQRILSETSVAKMTRLQTGDLKCGFVDGMGFGLGWAVVREPKGVTAALSPGSYGHGGAFGTQGWLDPAKDMFFVLLVQRSNLPNADASDLRRDLQTLAVEAIAE